MSTCEAINQRNAIPSEQADGVSRFFYEASRAAECGQEQGQDCSVDQLIKQPVCSHPGMTDQA